MEAEDISPQIAIAGREMIYSEHLQPDGQFE
jgi:hypothetical protein